MAYKNKEDQAAYARLHYQRNKGQYKQRAAAFKKVAMKRNMAFINRVKACFGCMDCGIKDPRVLDFDHLRDKRKSVATMGYNGTSIRAIKNEMRKCEVVCANCHRIRTYERIHCGIE